MLFTLAACSTKKITNTSQSDTTMTKTTPIISYKMCPLLKKGNVIPKNVIKILSIDGGGVKGIIPARILAEFEKRSGKPFSKLFDLMTGTSTGALIALGVNIPDESGAPKYKAPDLVDLYMESVKKIFYASSARKIYTGGGLWGPKYDRAQYDAVLVNLFGDSKMSQLMTPTAVTSYNMTKGKPQIWTRKWARNHPNLDFFVRDIACASSAAPTFFTPKLLIDKNNNSSYHIDGGLFAPNPELEGGSLAYKLGSVDIYFSHKYIPAKKTKPRYAIDLLRN